MDGKPYQKRVLNSYLIDNVEIWTDREVLEQAQVFVRDGRLIAFGHGIPQVADIEERIDGGGRVLLPAGVDAQTHLRVPGQPQKETPETGLTAALKGGYCAVLTMPNTKPTVDSPEVLKQGQKELKAWEDETGVHVFWSAAITRNLNSNELTPFEDLIRAGVRAFTNDGLGVMSDEVMESSFAALEKLGVPLLQHAEMMGHGGTLAPGPVQTKVGASPYSDEPEWRMVERDLRELRKHRGARYHVLHVSSRKTLDLVKAARAEGLKVTAEVTPHHLWFNTGTLRSDNTSFKMNPPIRSSEDQTALWTALIAGDLDFVATDHAPHEKAMKTGSFDAAAFGTIGLETTLSVLIEAYQQKRLTPKRLVEVFASKPAEFLRLPAGLGRFQAEAPFHAVWVDVKAPPRIYQEEDISSLSKNSCFIGAELPGRILGAFHERAMYSFS
jgi:dihydroorotase